MINSFLIGATISALSVAESTDDNNLDIQLDDFRLTGCFARTNPEVLIYSESDASRFPVPSMRFLYGLGLPEIFKSRNDVLEAYFIEGFVAGERVSAIQSHIDEDGYPAGYTTLPAAAPLSCPA